MARLVRWTPTNTPIRTPFDRFFEDLYGSFENEHRDNVVAPRLDIIDGTESVEVQVELPGVAPEHVNIEFDKGILSIATIQPQVEGETASESALPGYTRRERYQGAYRRTLRVPDTIDTGNASAHFENGVLYLNLPKKPEAQPIRIPVKNGN